MSSKTGAPSKAVALRAKRRVQKETCAKSPEGVPTDVVDQTLRELRKSRPNVADPRPQFISIKSNYDKLKELGGPADLGISNLNLPMYCDEYPINRVGPILARVQKDDIAVRRHWPWASMAISLYAHERQEWTKYGAELQPKEVRGAINEIELAANRLQLALSRLHEISHRLRDPTAPSHRGHLAWIDAYMSQAAAGRVSKEVDESAGALLLAYGGKNALIKRLAEIEAAAVVAAQRVDRELLNRERGQSDPALPNFVFRCGVVWGSLTGRPPNADKRRDRRDPEFVVFLQELAKLANIHPPSRAQIETSLKKVAPAIKAKLSRKSGA